MENEGNLIVFNSPESTQEIDVDHPTTSKRNEDKENVSPENNIILPPNNPFDVVFESANNVFCIDDGRESLGILNIPLEGRPSDMAWLSIPEFNTENSFLLNNVTNILNEGGVMESFDFESNVCAISLRNKTEKSVSVLVDSTERITLKDDYGQHNKTSILKDNKLEDEEFNDVIFMEARFIAAKFEDGSILHEDDDVLWSLDKTTEPELIHDEEVNKSAKFTTKDIFKTVDRAFPFLNTCKEETNIESDFKINHSKEYTNTADSADDSPDLKNKIPKALQSGTSLRSHTSGESNKSKSKEAKQILGTLVEILQNEDFTSQQRTEGERLIFNLAQILCDSSRSLMEFSESTDCLSNELDKNDNDNKSDKCEVLDLCTKPLCGGESKPLDLSKKGVDGTSSIEEVPSTHHSTANEHKTKSIFGKLGKSGANIPGNINKVNSFGKFKAKKTGDKKSGPLKAVLPVVNMAKILKNEIINKTPPKSQSNYNFKNKLTPVSEQLVPVAQSTPNSSHDDKILLSPSHLPKPKFNGNVSPLARPNVSSANKSSDAKITGMTRRKSASDVVGSSKASGLKRWNSFTRTNAVASSVNRVTESINKFKRSVNNSEQEGRTLSEVNRQTTANNLKAGKPFNLMSKLKFNAGKENMRN